MTFKNFIVVNSEGKFDIVKYKLVNKERDIWRKVSGPDYILKPLSDRAVNPCKKIKEEQ